MNKLSIRQKIYLSKRISFLLEAGISLPEVLRILSFQLKKNRKILEDIADKIAEGQLLSDIFQTHNIFGKIALPIIRIGEESGTFVESFNLLSQELEKKYELRQKIIGAILYPVCIFTGMLILLGVLLIVVFPKLIGVFGSLHLQLPLSTQVLIFLSSFLQKWGISMVLISLVAYVLSLILYKRNPTFQQFIQFCILKIPWFGRMNRMYVVASISRTIGLLLQANADVITAFTIGGESLSNTLYRESIISITKTISRGDTISKALAQFPTLFPTEYMHMVAVGERSGRLSETFLYLQQIYTRDLDSFTKGLSASLEPVLMIVLGLAVGLIAFSIIGPMYQITQNLHAH